MRNLFCVILVAVLGGIILSLSPVYAQMTLTSSTSSIEIKIEPGTPVASVYSLNFASLSFPDEDRANAFFNGITSNIAIFSSLNFTTKTVAVKLNTTCNDTAGWGNTEWNAYFTERNPKLLPFYNFVLE
ncbi:MAG: hypothetical protein EAZ57_09755 [Cytophagales bacterium]|nr:MAG: hypothetical protein EAZ67_10265 [Cytophagales bacterium]TAF59820.1 MAG: hypothetical protein EAZ57_09755 [Cytophagales bacterium]